MLTGKNKNNKVVIATARMGTAKEIASVAAFLASSDSSYITAETIAAGGGNLSRLWSHQWNKKTNIHWIYIASWDQQRYLC